METETGSATEAADTPVVEPTTPTEAPAPSSEPATMEDTMAATYDAIMERERAEDTPTEEEPVEASEPEEATEEEEISVQPEEEADTEPEQEAQPEPSVDVPNSWTAEAKERWADIPPETQEYIAEREKQAHEQISRMGQELSATKPLLQLLDSHEQTFAKYGLTPGQGVEQLLAVQTELETNPRGTIQKLAQMYGVTDYNQLAEGGTEQQGQVDPQLSQLMQQVQSLESKLSVHDQLSKQRQMEEQAAIQAQAQKELEESGMLEKPHFDKLRPAMAALLETELATTIEEAYEQAAWADKDVRNALLEEQKKAELETKAKAAAEAKKSAKVSKGSKGRPQTAPKRTWEETIEYEATKRMG